jgi:tetratricopeptide (TPR) repeat protein
MAARLGRGLAIIALVLFFAVPSAFAQRGGRGGGGARMGGGGLGGGGARPGGFPAGGGGGGARLGGSPAGGFGGSRPGGGGLSQSPAVSNLGPARQPSGGVAAAGRPSALPAGPSLGTRPSVGQPGAGAGRPSTFPGGASLGNRPNVGPSDAGAGLGNRPGIGNVAGVGPRAPRASNLPANVAGNRPINTGNINTGNINRGNVNFGNASTLPAYNNWRGGYGGYHAGWANGYWHGYNANNNWNWGAFGVGAAVGVTSWAMGSALFNWGYGSYANPYYYGSEAVAQPIVIQQASAEGVPQTISVPVAVYDYSQPLDTQSTPPPAGVADPAIAKFDAARASFGSGDYANALKLTDEALKVLPNDATLHEFRALVLFAVGKYDLAAGPLYAVLSVGPGWDWTTMAGLYPNIDVYTRELRKLEAFVVSNAASAPGHFVLAYHYMTQGNNDAAAGQFKQVVALTPQDTLAAQLLKVVSPAVATAGTDAQPSEPQPVATAAATAATASVKPGALAGTWTAKPAPDTSIVLRLGDDKRFTWTVTQRGKPRDITGDWSLANDMLTMAQAGQGSAMVGRVAWQSENRWTFRVMGAGPDDPGLAFSH